MSTVIVACSSLLDYVDAAQRAQGTQYPVVSIDKGYHNEPERMKQALLGTINALSPEADTVLVAMGFCGGAWSEVAATRRVVIPRVDDCISLLLHMDDDLHPNLKEPGHMYIVEQDPREFSVEKMLQGNMIEYRGLSQEALFQMLFGNYRNLDIVDTGLTDCYSEEYVTEAQKNADRLDAALGYVPGSNHLLEKLVAGRWDEQFIVAEPGTLIRHGSFF